LETLEALVENLKDASLSDEGRKESLRAKAEAAELERKALAKQREERRVAMVNKMKTIVDPSIDQDTLVQLADVLDNQDVSLGRSPATVQSTAVASSLIASHTDGVVAVAKKISKFMSTRGRPKGSLGGKKRFLASITQDAIDTALNARVRFLLGTHEEVYLRETQFDKMLKDKSCVPADKLTRFIPDKGEIDLVICDPPYADEAFYKAEYVTGFLKKLRLQMTTDGVVLYFGNPGPLTKLQAEIRSSRQFGLSGTNWSMDLLMHYFASTRCVCLCVYVCV
jgi:hypothetical protein